MTGLGLVGRGSRIGRGWPLPLCTGEPGVDGGQTRRGLFRHVGRALVVDAQPRDHVLKTLARNERGNTNQAVHVDRVLDAHVQREVIRPLRLGWDGVDVPPHQHLRRFQGSFVEVHQRRWLDELKLVSQILEDDVVVVEGRQPAWVGKLGYDCRSQGEETQRSQHYSISVFL